MAQPAAVVEPAQAIGDGGYAHKDEGRGGRERDDGEGEHRRRAAERRQPQPHSEPGDGEEQARGGRKRRQRRPQALPEDRPARAAQRRSKRRPRGSFGATLAGGGSARRDFRHSATTLSAVGGVWAVVSALAVAIAVLLAINFSRLPTLRATMDAGANASALPALSVASLVGFGAVVAALPAFALVRDWVLGIEGGPLVSLAVATNVLASLTGSASGGLTIALDSLGAAYMKIAAEQGINPDLLHRVAVIGAGTLDSLPHNGAVVTLLAVCGSTHRESYLDIVMVAIVGAILGLVAVIGLGTAFGSF
jgi:hypothetical protein